MAAKFIGLADIEDVIKVGRFGELGKRDTILEDLEKKAEHISEIIRQKETLEVEMAPALDYDLFGPFKFQAIS